eukprot:TRINITY_DN937_c0_g2_i5.p2 TRINITY_DN937_c0_g2~~TRINITY_DN937_c0_g2_i5.p2  ORF type:complete len:169 (+),score=16.60 TRINITY_DN937_c0_g2_i5:70-507(+)
MGGMGLMNRPMNNMGGMPVFNPAAMNFNPTNPYMTGVPQGYQGMNFNNRPRQLQPSNDMFSSRNDEYKTQVRPSSVSRKRTPFDDDYAPGGPRKTNQIPSSAAAEDLFGDVRAQPQTNSRYNAYTTQAPTNPYSKPNNNDLFDFS